ncbi:MAG TPA: NFACT RNA binding domain-containing protein [Clostridia bacterium]|nr:NFACT RNA binding domain-containing protein [Clostridia bacterium]
MPFDGVVTKCIVNELTDIIVGGRVEKIYQPESDEIVIGIRSKGENLKLVLSSSPNYPRIHITETIKENPSVPPVFCMLLRKHLSGGRITGIEFHDFERIVTILIESVNELGDLTTKKLIIEIMGRHSNIILTNSQNRILDSIKHVDSEISSKREIMPAREYSFPPSQDKISPEILDIEQFIDGLKKSAIAVEKYILNEIKGFSPFICSGICQSAEINGKMPATSLDRFQTDILKKSLEDTIQAIKNSRFQPFIIYCDKAFKEPLDFYCLRLSDIQFEKQMNSMNNVLDFFYAAKDGFERLKQKKADILKVLNSNIERCHKKLAIQQDKLREVSDREKLKLYGELITANIYCMPASVGKVSLLNYYSENEEYVDIPLDENLSAQQNAQRYFKRYTKAKSAFFNTNVQHAETLIELEYLESVLHLLDNCSTLQEISEIRQELSDEGYIAARKKDSKKNIKTSQPLHFTSSDGYEILVGKNNRQNDLLTLKTASSNDMWLHTKNIPGSHVIIKKQQSEIPETTLMEAALLAAYHSKAKMSSNVPVDYTQVRNVKKPGGAKPGMVIYENYRTVIVTPDEDKVNKMK